MMCRVSPICDYATAAEVNEEGGLLSLEKTIDDGFDAWFVVRVAIIC